MSNVAYFDHVYENDDPFGYRTRWYEVRKRALLLASLPSPRYERGWELGCSNGVLTAELAHRCAQLHATDLSEAAIATARASLADQDHVTLECAQHPQQWPEGRFDLIVFSEIGYYLSPEQMRDMAGRLCGSLSFDGVLVSCHWLHAFDEARCSADFVHAQFDARLPQLFCYRDEDLLLQGWSRMTTSVAAREGLR
ncbi:class I SAM-dependent methyltransferase [Stenotrophomonas oahuensis]|uniref:Class I SAM-dependent methyltransferase n=1 Tax=Stenotrophomonas oahuensis TaxID=3003271 RepID=A0ABY9YMY5_9GAMM|nr:class I SAM-dependent methyltransferase [Stenotrophomonas sp. A5586]WNH51815.1 class I SAM-dependent methyltransferase [Stenotrophomonas sp. A5586]